MKSPLRILIGLCVPAVLLAGTRVAEAAKPLPWHEGSVTIAVLPDTQYYTKKQMSSGKSFRDRFPAQTEWIAKRQDERNIAYVFHLGDITQDNTPEQWQVARDAFDQIEDKVPYVVLPGNHDYGGREGGKASTRLNDYFSYEKTRQWPTFGGAFEPGKLDNTYHLFNIHDQKWIVVALECWPRAEAIEWADKAFAQHRDRKGILITHAYLSFDDTRIKFAENKRMQPGSMWQADGEAMWNVVRKYPHMMFVITGHVASGDGVGYLASEADHGNTVHQILVDYQARRGGGDAYMRLFEFLPDGKTVQIKSWSPYRKAYKTDYQNQFTVSLQGPTRDEPKPVDHTAATSDDFKTDGGEDPKK